LDWTNVLADLGLVLLGALKFLVFAPIIAVKHNFATGLILNLISGTLGISVFYFLSDYFMDRAKEKRARKIRNGTAKPKKNFTKVNKFLVRTKRALGMLGIAIISPTGISIPIGSIVMAKFYGDNKWAYPSLMISMVLWALLIGGIAAQFPDLFDQIFPNARN